MSVSYCQLVFGQYISTNVNSGFICIANLLDNRPGGADHSLTISHWYLDASRLRYGIKNQMISGSAMLYSESQRIYVYMF